MFTVISYILLKFYFGVVLILPVLLDLVIINWMDKI